MQIIFTLLAYKVLLPGHMHLTRGNHETKAMNKLYGFDGEVGALVAIFDLFRVGFGARRNPRRRLWQTGVLRIPWQVWNPNVHRGPEARAPWARSGGGAVICTPSSRS
jgi:hypothetical protein